MNPVEAIIKLGAQLDEERNAASDLWTWLPSYKVAERYHGDYATEFMPSVSDVMREAAAWFAARQYPATDRERGMFETCPCGEEHDQ